MVDAGELLDRLDWGRSNATLPYQVLAERLASHLAPQTPVEHVARGWIDVWECLVVATPDALVVGKARAFGTDLDVVPWSDLRTATVTDGERAVVDVIAPGRRHIAHLFKDAAALALIVAVRERIEPTVPPTYEPYTPRRVLRTRR